MTDNEKNSATEITTDDEKILANKTWDRAVHYDPRDTIAQQQKTINRQKEQIESLIAGQETLQKYIAEKDAEIERLKKIIKSLEHSVYEKGLL